MTSHTPEPWTYGVRRDGSIWMSLGDPTKGPHRQRQSHRPGRTVQRSGIAPAVPLDDVEAWLYEHDGMVHSESYPAIVTTKRWAKCEEPWNETPLVRGRTLIAPAVPSMPVGWKLVPETPSPAMRSAGAAVDWRVFEETEVMVAKVYRAMLAASPPAPTEGGA